MASGAKLSAGAAEGQTLRRVGRWTIKLFDLASLKEVRAFTGQTDWVFGLDFSATSGLLASGSADGQVRIWEADSGKPVSNFYAAPDWWPQID